MAKNIKVKINPESEVTTEILAEAILAMSDGIKRLRSGQLNDKALILLIQHAAPSVSRSGAPISQKSLRQIKLAQRARRARIREIRRECFMVIRRGRGRWQLVLRINQQYFDMMGDKDGGHYFSSKQRAWWFATQAAIALHRFKYGS